MNDRTAFEQDLIDAPRHRKKSKTSSKSNSSKRADHKHEYETVIVRGWLFGWQWGKRCRICGRMDETWSSYKNREFIRPEKRNEPGVSSDSYYTADEIKVLFPDYSVYGIADGYEVWDGVYELIE